MGKTRNDPTFLRGRRRHFRNLATHTRDEAMRPFYAEMAAAYEAELSALTPAAVPGVPPLNTDHAVGQ